MREYDLIAANTLIKGALIIAFTGLIINNVIGLSVYFNTSNTAYVEEKRLFPQIIGETVLKSNETGTHLLKNITTYDDFRGNIIQGYKAIYSGINGTMLIYIAEMPDSPHASISLKDMIIRAGYNESAIPDENTTVIKLFGQKLNASNPDIFIIQKKDSATWHYAFAKLDKVYWIAFDKPDIPYQLDMLKEVYININRFEFTSTEKLNK